MSPVPVLRRHRVAAAALLLVMTAGCTSEDSAPTPVASATAVATGAAAEVVTAAGSFLALLDDPQRTAVTTERTPETLAQWSDLPDPQFKRAGLAMDALTEPQRAAALGILRAGLSTDGFRQLDTGAGPAWIRILGAPSGSAVWTVQYGGRLLAVNLTVRGSALTLAPTLWGAPSAQPLGGEVTKARALMDALDRAQRQQAILDEPVTGIVLGPGQDGRNLPPVGVRANSFTDEQNDLLVALLTEWMTTLAPAAATTKLAAVQQGLDDTTFAWSGTTTPGEPMYYRVQGPLFTIELARHRDAIRGIYREPGNDYVAY